MKSDLKMIIFLKVISVGMASFFQRWSKVYVPNSYLNDWKKEPFERKSLLLDINGCRNIDWCTLVCYDNDEGFYSIVYVNSNLKGGEINITECYTPGSKSIAINGEVFGTRKANHKSHNRKIQKNIVDGYFAFNEHNCFITYNSKMPWIAIDLLEVFPINSIAVFMIDSVNNPSFDLYLGKTKNSADQIVDEVYIGEFLEDSFESKIVFELNKKYSGRYIIFKYRCSSICQPSLCHIDVD